MIKLINILRETKIGPKKTPTVVFNEIWNDQSKDYLELINKDPIYNELDKVVANPAVKKEAFNWANEQYLFYKEDNEDEDEDELSMMFGGFAQDNIDYIIMKNFVSQLAKNLIEAGFEYDKNEDSWFVPDEYLNKTSSYKELTSYGIIWEFFDYDTNVRETIGSYLEEAAQNILQETKITPKSDYKFKVGELAKEMSGDELDILILDRRPNWEAVRNYTKNPQYHWTKTNVVSIYVDEENKNKPWYLGKYIIPGEDREYIFWIDEHDLEKK